jgi:hypothetical protein
LGLLSSQYAIRLKEMVEHGLLRNTKQVKNILSQQKYEKALSKDDIYNLVLLAYQLNGFISEMLVYPAILHVSVHGSEMPKELKVILRKVHV